MPKNPQRFGGLLTNCDLKDVPPGMMVSQTNIGNYMPGRLDVRKGLGRMSVPWSFTPSGTADAIALYGYLAPQARWLVMGKTDGTVKAFRDGGTQAVLSGLNTFQPINCAVDLYDKLIVVNGIERGSRWDGVSSTPQELGIDSPIDLWGDGANATPAIDSTYLPGTGNVRNDSLYYMAYRYVDADGIPSSISEIKEFRTEAGASGTKIQWLEDLDGTPNNGNQTKASTQTRVTKIEFLRSVANSPAILYKVHEVTNSSWTTGSSYQDDMSDADMLASDPDDVLPIFDPDGFENARRFNKPPTNKPFVAMCADVLLMYGRVFYDEGTLAATNGNATHTGSGTALRSEMVGWRLRYVGETTEYEVATVNEGGQTFTTTVVYAGATGSGKSYVLSPNASEEAYNLRFSVRGEPESMPVVYANRVQVSADRVGKETGLFSMGGYAYLFHEQSFHRVSYGTNPALDMDISPAMQRGLVANTCVIEAEDKGWAFDQLGAYSFGPGGFADISTDKIRDLFETRIDWSPSVRKYYFTSYQPHARILRLHVQYTGDANSRPKRALCYNTVTGEWWDEQYPMEVCGAVVVDVDGTQRLVLGGADDELMLVGEGTSDVVAAAYQGTLTSASTGTALVDSGASFGTDVVGAPVSIIFGTGKGTTRTIATRTNGTTLVVNSNWTVGTDSVYVIGAISWSLKTGGYEYVAPEQGGETAAANVKRCLKLQHLPTTFANWLTAKFFLNRSASAMTRSQKHRDPTNTITYHPDGEIVIDMANTRGSGSKDAGFSHLDLDSTVADSQLSERFLQVYLEGVQGKEACAVTAIDMKGFG